MTNQATSEDYIRDEMITEWFESNVIAAPLPPFVEYKKIPRYRRDIIITEKIDGTNAVIHISESGILTAGSRTRWITTGKKNDNHGFAAWCVENHEELLKLGVGYTFGEWYGSGINRGYGLQKGEKRLALFVDPAERTQGELPGCCEVTPRLYDGPRDEYWIQRCLNLLEEQGSYAVPGYMRPEGIVIFDVASRGLHKITIDNDEAPKGSIRLG